MEKLFGWIETEDLYNTIEDLKIIFFEPQIWDLNRSASWWSSICACQEFHFRGVIRICAKTSDYCWITYLTVNSRPFETMLSRTSLNKSKNYVNVTFGSSPNGTKEMSPSSRKLEILHSVANIKFHFLTFVVQIKLLNLLLVGWFTAKITSLWYKNLISSSRPTNMLTNEEAMFWKGSIVALHPFILLSC